LVAFLQQRVESLYIPLSRLRVKEKKKKPSKYSFLKNDRSDVTCALEQKGEAIFSFFVSAKAASCLVSCLRPPLVCPLSFSAWMREKSKHSQCAALNTTAHVHKYTSSIKETA
jgi:hypothetical protein